MSSNLSILKMNNSLKTLLILYIPVCCVVLPYVSTTIIMCFLTRYKKNQNKRSNQNQLYGHAYPARAVNCPTNSCVHYQQGQLAAVWHCSLHTQDCFWHVAQRQETFWSTPCRTGSCTWHCIVIKVSCVRTHSLRFTGFVFILWS